MKNLTLNKTYRCRVLATNAIGNSAWSSYSPTFDTTATAPEAPTVDAVTPQYGTEAVVEFTPGATGGSPITSYLAQCVSTNGGANRNSFGGSSPRTVKNLTLNKTYRCRVLATNAIGNSAWSSYSPTFDTTATAPEAPTVDAVTPQYGTEAVVEFTPGATGGSPITSFRAQCVSTNGGGTRAPSEAPAPAR